MDRQRMRYADDEQKSQKIPLIDVTLAIELDAAKLYTLELFYLVREEIQSGCYHTIVEYMSRDVEVSHFKFKDVLLNDQVFEVSVRHQDNHVTCSCNFFFRRGYLCRHCFAALNQCCVKQIPRQFVKARWSKNAVQQHSFLGSSEVASGCNAKERFKLKRKRVWFEFHNLLNLGGEDEDNVDIILGGFQKINSTLTEKMGTQTRIVSAHRADRFIQPAEGTEVSVQNPEVSRNKGCGSRIKSSRELSQQDRKRRKCSNCDQLVHHNARTCPEPKKTDAV